MLKLLVEEKETGISLDCRVEGKMGTILIETHLGVYNVLWNLSNKDSKEFYKNIQEFTEALMDAECIQSFIQEERKSKSN